MHTQTHTSLVDSVETHRICVNIGEQRGLLVEAAEDQLANHQGKVEVEGGESQLVAHFTLKRHKQTKDLKYLSHIGSEKVALKRPS